MTVIAAATVWTMLGTGCQLGDLPGFGGIAGGTGIEGEGDPSRMTAHSTRGDAWAQATSGADATTVEFQAADSSRHWTQRLEGFGQDPAIRIVGDRVVVVAGEGREAGDRMRSWLLDAADGRVIKEHTVDTDAYTAPGTGWGHVSESYGGLVVTFYAQAVEGVTDHFGDITTVLIDPDSGERIDFPEHMTVDCPDLGGCRATTQPAYSSGEVTVIAATVPDEEADPVGGAVVVWQPAKYQLFGDLPRWNSIDNAPAGANAGMAVVAAANEDYVLGRWETGDAKVDVHAGTAGRTVPVIYGLMDITTGALIDSVACGTAVRGDGNSAPRWQLTESADGQQLTAGPVTFDLTAGSATCVSQTGPGR